MHLKWSFIFMFWAKPSQSSLRDASSPEGGAFEMGTGRSKLALRESWRVSA